MLKKQRKIDIKYALGRKNHIFLTVKGTSLINNRWFGPFKDELEQKQF